MESTSIHGDWRRQTKKASFFNSPWEHDTGRAPISSLDRLQILARLEPDSLAGGDRHLFARSWISAYACLSRFDCEHSKSPQFNAIALLQCCFHGIKDRVYCHLSLCSWNSRSLHDLVDDV